LYYGTYYFNSNITGGGNSPSTISSTSTSATGWDINLTINAAGSRVFTVADATGDWRPDLYVSAVLGNGANAANLADTLIKAGPGTMSLTASNIYSGGTIVSNGTLQVNNTTGSGTGTGTVTVATNATLSGIGIISGAVTVQAGGSLVVGASTNVIGSVLTISNSLTLSAGSFTTNAISHNNQTNDQVVVTGTLTYGGTLTVITNAGDAPLVAGDTFTLFKTVSTNGNFSATNLPALSPGLVWNVNNLSAGVISVAPASVSPTAGFSAAPTNAYVLQTVVFTNTSTGTITNWFWNFGDGNTFSTGTGSNVTHAYSSAGTNTVSLIVTGPSGSSTNTQTGYIVVYPALSIASPVLSGGSLVLSGSGGIPGAQYRVLTSTNVALALANWTPVLTNTFTSPNGGYNYTSPPVTNNASFFILVSP
jgi:autotransporter-associated beta strand protein